MRRPLDRDDRKLGFRSLAAAAPAFIMAGWVVYNAIVEKRIPVGRTREITLADDPGLFWLVVVTTVGVFIVVVVGAVCLGRRHTPLRRRPHRSAAVVAFGQGRSHAIRSPHHA